MRPSQTALVLPVILLLLSSQGLGAETPESARMLNKAISLMSDHRAQDAVALLRQGVEQYPQSGSMHFELGNALCDCKEYQNAIDEYQTALKLQSIPEAIINIAYAYCGAGSPTLAIPWFQRFLSENPNHPKAQEVEEQMLVVQAGSAMEKQRPFDAKQLLERALQLKPDDTIALFRLARACDQLGDTQRAIQEYQQVLALHPDHSEAVFNIAGCYQSMGRPQEAIRWFETYLQRNPNAPDRPTVENMIVKLQEKGGDASADPRAPDFCSSVMENGKFFCWPPERMPLRVYIQEADGVLGFREGYRQLFMESLSAWAQASQGKLAFVLVRDPNRADITVSWTGNPYDVRQSGTDVEQGICKVRAFDRQGANAIRIDSANLRILTVDRETQKPLSDDDMKKTCLHELGHALGLHGHSNNNHDIMFFSVSPTVWPVLSKRDKATLLRIYAYYPVLSQP